MFLQFYSAHQSNSIWRFVLVVARRPKLTAFLKMMRGSKLAFGPNQQFFPIILVCPQSFDWYNKILTLCCSYASRHFEAACCHVHWSVGVSRLSKPARCTHSINKLVRVWDHPWRKYYNHCCRLGVPFRQQTNVTVEKFTGASGGKKYEGSSIYRKLSWDPLAIHCCAFT
jgi:hypothetical protein